MPDEGNKHCLYKAERREEKWRCDAELKRERGVNTADSSLILLLNDVKSIKTVAPQI
jgi:hypothetical protein